MDAVQVAILSSLLSEGYVMQDAYGYYLLTEKGKSEVRRFLSRQTEGRTIMIGLYYAEKLGISMDA